jgi:two-component system cell cycle response regulator DivK
MPTRILIADDYDDNRELLRLMLENAGYAVREARDGREFVDAARAEPPDVALIDLSMPVLDGWRALSELRSDARTSSLPCVAVTAFAAEIDRQRALAAGFDAYVTKPFRSTDLVEVVERLLKSVARGGDGSAPRDGDALPRAKEIGGTNDAGCG